MPTIKQQAERGAQSGEGDRDAKRRLCRRVMVGRVRRRRNLPADPAQGLQQRAAKGLSMARAAGARWLRKASESGGASCQMARSSSSRRQHAGRRAHQRFEHAQGSRRQRDVAPAAADAQSGGVETEIGHAQLAAHRRWRGRDAAAWMRAATSRMAKGFTR
jgi:hypothetical protein